MCKLDGDYIKVHTKDGEEIDAELVSKFTIEGVEEEADVNDMINELNTTTSINDNYTK